LFEINALVSAIRQTHCVQEKNTPPYVFFHISVENI